MRRFRRRIAIVDGRGVNHRRKDSHRSANPSISRMNSCERSAL